MKHIFLLILFCFVCLADVAAADHPPFDDAHEKVTLQLKWKHQFQFAGYYAALEQGYYRDVGLEVDIVARKPGPERPVDTLLSGRATYGIEGANALIRRLQGAPLVALAAIFQHSPAVAIALQKNGINTVKDMVGKRVMTYGIADAELHAMLLQEGIAQEDITWQPMSFKIDSLINGETDLYSGYLTNEPFFLQQQQIPYTIINPVNYGKDFYGDILFTTEQELIEHPQRVRAFRDASLKGWEYALAHPEEIVDMILSKYSQLKSREHLLFEAAETAKLIRPDLVEIGHINPGRFLHMGGMLQQLGQVEHTDKLAGFFYDDKIAGQFSNEELSWLTQKNKVRVRVGNVPPLLYFENGQPLGMAVDYLERISQDSGIEFEYLPEPVAWPEAVKGLIDHSRYDLIPTIRPSPERTELIAFTDTYLPLPNVVFTRQKNESVNSFFDLGKLKVAVTNGHLVHKFLTKEYPQMDLLVLTGVQAPLEALATGRADAYIGDLIVGTYHIRKAGLSNIKVAAPVPFETNDMAMGARGDWPELQSIINRTLRQMSPEEHHAIRTKWLAVEYAQGGVDPEILYWLAVCGVALVTGLGLFWAWTRSLKLEIKRRKVTENALLNSVQLYQHLLQAIPHGIVELDQNLLITYCNTPFAEMLGYDSHELLGNSLIELVSGDETLHSLQKKMGLLEQNGQHVSVELKLIDKQQQFLDVQFDLDTREKSDQGEQIIIVTDLTLQEQTEQALKRSDALYRSTFEFIQAGVAHMSLEGNFTRVNSYLCQHLGYSAAELLNLNMMKISHPDDVPICEDQLKRLVEQKVDSYTLSKRFLQKDGTPIWVLFSVALLQQLGGENCLVTVFQDIDELKLQQEVVAEKSHNLEEIIGRRTAELQSRVTEVEELNLAMLNLTEDLQSSYRQLEEKSEEVRDVNNELEAFAYSVSHDLRAPLRHAQGFAEILLESSQAELSEANRRHLGTIMGSTNRMGQLIDDLLAFSRAARSELHFCSVDTALIVKEVVSALKDANLDREIDWLIDKLPVVTGDLATLRQVFTNLLENAVKYSAPKHKAVIRISCGQGTKEMIFCITDNGVGFDPEYTHKLFEVFSRLHRADQFEGTGIGLANVKRIVKRHGGEVWAESGAESGASFYFTLPEN